MSDSVGSRVAVQLAVRSVRFSLFFPSFVSRVSLFLYAQQYGGCSGPFFFVFSPFVCVSDSVGPRVAEQLAGSSWPCSLFFPSFVGRASIYFCG